MNYQEISSSALETCGSLVSLLLPIGSRVKFCVLIIIVNIAELQGTTSPSGHPPTCNLELQMDYAALFIVAEHTAGRVDF